MITASFLFSHFGRVECPVCEGGSSREKSLNIWEDGYYRLAKCHRASCGAFAKFPMQSLAFRGYQGSGGKQIAAPAPPAEVLRPYTGALYDIDAYPNVSNAFQKKYGFPGQGVMVSDYRDSPLFIPILGPKDQVRGHVEKRGLFPGEQKSNRIWKAKNEPMISWANTPGALSWDEAWLVEDQISALKLAARGQRAIALLGTNLTPEAVAEIQRKIKHVTIALDADATAKAFKLARRWGAAFSSCKVKILLKDIKNDSEYNRLPPAFPPGSVVLTRGQPYRSAISGYGGYSAAE